MAMCASSKGREKAKGKCPPKKVAKEYRDADIAKGYKRLGSAKS